MTEKTNLFVNHLRTAVDLTDEGHHVAIPKTGAPSVGWPSESEPRVVAPGDGEGAPPAKRRKRNRGGDRNPPAQPRLADGAPAGTSPGGKAAGGKGKGAKGKGATGAERGLPRAEQTCFKWSRNLEGGCVSNGPCPTGRLHRCEFCFSTEHRGVDHV